MIVTIQTALLRSDAYLLDAALQPRARVIVSAIAGVLALGLGVALAPSLGMAGVCLGLVVGRAVQSIAYPVLVAASLGGRKRVAWAPLVRPTLASVLVLGPSAAWGARLLAPGWIACAAAATASFSLLLPLALCIGLPDTERQRLIMRSREIWRGMTGKLRHG